jgi:hypothetical protein
MALTEIQQNEVEYQAALHAASDLSNTEVRSRERKENALRQAQAIIFENRRLLTSSEATDVTASSVIALADELLAYVESSAS